MIFNIFKRYNDLLISYKEIEKSYSNKHDAAQEKFQNEKIRILNIIKEQKEIIRIFQHQQKTTDQNYHNNICDLYKTIGQKDREIERLKEIVSMSAQAVCKYYNDKN